MLFFVQLKRCSGAVNGVSLTADSVTADSVTASSCAFLVVAFLFVDCQFLAAVIGDVSISGKGIEVFCLVY